MKYKLITELIYRRPSKASHSPYHGKIRLDDQYVYFYMGVPLSNWYNSPAIPFDGREFSSSETIYMYLKAKHFGDMEMADKISHEGYYEAKKLGKLVKGFDDSEWDKYKYHYMCEALEAKYVVDETFREFLLMDIFDGKTFVEASPYDRVWGIGVECTDDVMQKGKESWKGSNMLGLALTELRDRKKSERPQ